MSVNIDIVRKFYNEGFQREWERLDRHQIEFEITRHFLNMYIKPGDKVLDIGGGPGRYSLLLARMGCDVTLLDLSEKNVEFALEKAAEEGVSIKAVAGDARFADEILRDETGKFDAVLNMGPMYHLLEEDDRRTAIRASINMLKDNGALFVSFISLNAGMSYAMKNDPAMVLMDAEARYISCFLRDETYCGDVFTKAAMIAPKDILPFMEGFPLEKLHLFGQESITSPAENNIMAQSGDVVRKWIEIGIKVCEREDFLSFPEHLMYVGRKNGRFSHVSK